MAFDPDAFLGEEFDPDSFIGKQPIPRKPQDTGFDFNSIPAVPGLPLTAIPSVIKAIPNIPESAGKFAGSIYDAVRHPIDTAENIYKLGSGIVQLAIPGEQGNEETAKAVGRFFADRYGSMDAVKKTFETDPVGFLADASALLTGGGTMAAKLPGLSKISGLSKVASQAADVGRAINPIGLMSKAAMPIVRGAGKLTSEVIGGIGTHTGGESIRRAASAGFKGGDVADDFRSAMRRGAPMENVVTDAKLALSNIRKAKGQEYRSGMVDISKDKSILDFKPIDKAVSEVHKIGTFKGKSISKSTTGTTKDINNLINEWRGYKPSEFHTPEGMDALKKAVGDIRDASEYGSPSRLVADRVYNAVKSQITKQAPAYAKVMSGYEKGAKLVKELESTLSLKSAASPDTALRKLQSVLRDNANTNYGRRGELAQILTDAGAPNLMEKLAGQSLSSVVPRGLGKAVATGFGGVGLATSNPSLLAPLLLTSPRLMGEASYYGGKGAGMVGQLEGLLNKAGTSTQGAGLMGFQGGRLEDMRSHSPKKRM